MKRDCKTPNLSVAILAGGESRRMQRNKALEMLMDKPLIAHIIDSLRPVTDDLFIVAKEKATYQQFGVPVCLDRYNFQASLVGIHAAVDFSQHDCCLVVACDMPFVEPCLAGLLGAFSDRYDAVVPLSWRGREPLLAIYSKSCLPSMQACIGKKDLAIQPLLDVLNTKYVETEKLTGCCDPSLVFKNVNSEIELALAHVLYTRVVKHRRDGLAASRPPARPLICFVGKKNSGKTTFLEKLVRELKSRGFKVAYLKHDAHEFEMDRKGTDTWRIAQAGAQSVTICSRAVTATVETVTNEKSLEELASRIGEPVDIIVAEGYKQSAADKVEISRSGRSSSLACHEDELVAVISDRPDAASRVPTFDLNDVNGVTEFVMNRYRLISDM